MKAYSISKTIRCTKVRTLKGVPQPSSVCPVGDFDLAVLCKREIRVLDLDEGKFKVRDYSGHENISITNAKAFQVI